ncbi:hypothetical protein B0H14DRAFT_3433824 [Mycena olivaceomarginata]|nr:hypothetical protein B0H14DRAFT_3433824 [Mycena olivaceomarginata]
MSLPALGTITGCLLVATWASSLLYMSEVYQGLYYFRHFKKDDWKFKALVTVALLIDTVSIVSNYSCVYLYTITHAGDLEYLSNGHWPLTLYAFTTGVLGALVQSFLVFRYWRFTQNSLISLVLSFGIIIAVCRLLFLRIAHTNGIAAQLGSVFTISCMVALSPSIKDRPKLGPSRRSGAAAATLAGAALISYYVAPESNLDGTFLFPLGRVYVITLVRIFFHISRSVWDVLNYHTACESQYPDVRKVPFDDSHVLGSWNGVRRIAKAIDINQLEC